MLKPIPLASVQFDSTISVPGRTGKSSVSSEAADKHSRHKVEFWPAYQMVYVECIKPDKGVKHPWIWIPKDACKGLVPVSKPTYPTPSKKG